MAVTDLFHGSKVTFASQVTGPITYEYSSGPPSTQGGGLSHWFLREIVKPAFYVQGPMGQPMAYEPYGKPQHDWSAAFGLGVVVVAVGSAWGLYKAVQLIERRKRGSR